jgi:hypothetical protein
LCKRRSDPEVKDIVDVLNDGIIIPYVSFEHVLELLQPSDRKTRNEQMDFFRVLRHISFPKPISFPSPLKNSPICGSILDLQESEISILLENPNLTQDQVIDFARPKAVAGLCSGLDLWNDECLSGIAKSGRAINTLELNKAAASMEEQFPPIQSRLCGKPGVERYLFLFSFW